MKRLRLILILIAALVLGILAFAIFHDREPRYQGRTLTEWIEEASHVYSNHAYGVGGWFGESFETNRPEWQQASHAVKQMAPDAIPLLLKWLQADDSRLRSRVIGWLNSHPFIHFPMKTSRSQNMMALHGFNLLGEEGRPARPILVNLTANAGRERRLWALTCLAWTKADKETMLPVFGRMIHDPVWGMLVAGEFAAQFPKEAEAAGVYELFPEIKVAPL